MPPNNGVIERMKAACHTIVSVEMARSTRRINNADDYRRRRLPQIYAEFEPEWREAYTADPSITVNRFVELALGTKVAANAAARSVMEDNMARVKAMAAEPVDAEANLAGLARARAALRSR